MLTPCYTQYHCPIDDSLKQINKVLLVGFFLVAVILFFNFAAVATLPQKGAKATDKCFIIESIHILIKSVNTIKEGQKKTTILLVPTAALNLNPFQHSQSRFINYDSFVRMGLLLFSYQLHFVFPGH